MIVAKTCLILGAGASAPYGLPPAKPLRDLILCMRTPSGPETALNYPLFRADGTIQDYRTDTNPNLTPESRLLYANSGWVSLLDRMCTDAGFSDAHVADFRNAFYRARRQSIDKFIQFNEADFGAIGRTNIATVLLNCEKDRWLDGNWYVQLLDAVVPNTPDDLAENRLSIVSFNYDRSLEYFFTTAFEAGFHLTGAEAIAMFRRISVVHVYGQLGTLEELPYGDIRLFRDAAARIDLVRAGETNPRQGDIDTAIEEAENICFIGFAFAPENLALLNRKLLKGKSLVATVRGLAPPRLTEIKKAIPGIRFFDGTADELLRTQNLFEKRKTVAQSDYVKPQPSRSNWVLGNTRWER